MEKEYPARQSLLTESLDSNSTAELSKKSLKVRKPTVNINFKSALEIDSDELTRELRRIQLILFCEIENGEIARFLMKLNTVTEVNCPHLLGFLYFFERVKDLTITEILSKKDDVNQARNISYFIQVARSSFKIGNKQSTLAILSGLCSPLVCKCVGAWVILCKRETVIKNILDLIDKCWDTKAFSPTHIPIFRTFFIAICDMLMEKKVKFGQKPKHTENTWKKLSNWLTSKEERKSKQVTNQAYTIHSISKFHWQTNNHQNQMINRRKKYFLNELRTSCKEETLDSILSTIEKFRMCYYFKEIVLNSNESTKHFLLLKPFKNEY